MGTVIITKQLNLNFAQVADALLKLDVFNKSTTCSFPDRRYLRRVSDPGVDPALLSRRMIGSQTEPRKVLLANMADKSVS